MPEALLAEKTAKNLADIRVLFGSRQSRSVPLGKDDLVLRDRGQGMRARKQGYVRWSIDD